MRTRDDILKIKAASLYLLDKVGGSMDYVRLYKLLYFAQEHSLATYGREIINDTFYACTRGPVPGFLNASVKRLVSRREDQANLDIVADAIARGENFEVRALESPDRDDVSGSYVECLDWTLYIYGGYTLAELMDATHKDAGWKKADKRRKSDPDKSYITRLEMADAAGIEPSLRQYLKSQIELDALLGK